MQDAIAQELPGISMKMYRQVIARAGTGTPPGLILCAVGPAGENLRMIEVWELKADRERFVSTRIAAGRAKGAGGVAPPPPPHGHFELDVADLVRP